MESASSSNECSPLYSSFCPTDLAAIYFRIKIRLIIKIQLNSIYLRATIGLTTRLWSRFVAFFSPSLKFTTELKLLKGMLAHNVRRVCATKSLYEVFSVDDSAEFFITQFSYFNDAKLTKAWNQIWPWIHGCHWRKTSWIKFYKIFYFYKMANEFFMSNIPQRICCSCNECTELALKLHIDKRLRLSGEKFSAAFVCCNDRISSRAFSCTCGMASLLSWELALWLWSS